MEVWSHAVAAMDALILRDPMDIVIAMAIVLAAPMTALFTRSVVLTAAAITLTALPLWGVITAVQPPMPALWLAITWLALNVLQIAALMNRRNMLMVHDVLESLAEVDYRIDTFLDALDRRAALGLEPSDLRVHSRARESQVRSMQEPVS